MTNENINTELYEHNSENEFFRSYGYIAIKELYQGNMEGAIENFTKAHSILGVAYCKLIKGEKEEAKVLLKLIKDSSPAANWLEALICILEDSTEIIPTYMQIRSFYEQDLNMFFLYGNKKFASKMLEKNSFFECFNREIYKYAGRVLGEYGEDKKSEEFLKKSLDMVYNDAETHFLLGELYMKQKKKDEAIKEFCISDEIAHGYLPARKKLKELYNN